MKEAKSWKYKLATVQTEREQFQQFYAKTVKVKKTMRF